MNRGSAVAAFLLKTASSNAGVLLGKAIRTAGSAAKATVVGAGSLGAGVAEGLGANPEVGRLVGMGTAGAAGLSVANQQKRRLDDWRYRNGLYRQY